MASEIKVEKDVEEVRALIKDIDVITGEVKKIESAWNAYEKSIPAKNVGDDEIAVLFKKLLSKDYRYLGSDTDKTKTTIYDENRLNTDSDGADNTLKKGLFFKFDNANRRLDSQYLVNDSMRANFKKTLIELCEKLKGLNTTSPELKETNSNEYTAIINKIGSIDLKTQKFTLTEFYSDKKIIDNTPPADNNKKTTDKHMKDISVFINEAKDIYDKTGKDEQYSITERKNISEYFKKSENKLDTFFNPIKKSQELITTKVNDVLSKLIDISTKYSGLDSRIKKDVLEKLKPKDIAAKSDIKIIDIVTTIVDKFTEDFKIHMNILPVSGGARKKKQKQLGGAKVDREIIPAKFKEAIDNTDTLKKVAAELYKGLTRFSKSDKSYGNKDSESIFSKLFEKYITTKENKDTGGDFVASKELINDLKSNDLYPDDILKIDMRDKFVFIAVTLFMRIISLIIIEIIIDRKIITRMDTAIFWYGITMTLFIIVFVLIVNFDSYKLRIIFNYVNFHVGYSTTFSYIFQLWLFGGMVYYMMLKINDDIISSATNDEDRARLKHKVQVISMITWFFLSLGVLLM